MTNQNDNIPPLYIDNYGLHILVPTPKLKDFKYWIFETGDKLKIIKHPVSWSYDTERPITYDVFMGEHKCFNNPNPRPRLCDDFYRENVCNYVSNYCLKNLIYERNQYGTPDSSRPKKKMIEISRYLFTKLWNEATNDDKKREITDVPIYEGVFIKPSSFTQINDEYQIMIKNDIIKTFQSYKGNWVVDSFDEDRQKKVLSYITHKYKDNMNPNEIEKIFAISLNEIAQIDVKPYGQ